MGCKHGIEGACTRCQGAALLARKDAEIERLNAQRREWQAERETLLARLAASGVQARREEREAMCAAIKAADDKGSEGDCISVIRGTWKGDA